MTYKKYNAASLRPKSRTEPMPAHKIKGRARKAAYANMPKRLIDYVVNMPEYNPEIFTKITGIDA